MALSRGPGADGSLTLSDLRVGQRFASRSRAVDTERIKAFAAQFDPQVFHLDEAAQKATWFGGSGDCEKRIGENGASAIIDGEPTVSGQHLQL